MLAEALCVDQGWTGLAHRWRLDGLSTRQYANLLDPVVNPHSTLSSGQPSFYFIQWSTLIDPVVNPSGHLYRLEAQTQITLWDTTLSSDSM